MIKSLRRLIPDIHVVGLSYDPLESGLYSDGLDRVDSAYLLPFYAKGPEILLDRILHIHKKEQFQILIPCLDSELSNFITIYPALQERGIEAMLPSRAAFAKRLKENLIGFCERNKILSPKTFVSNDVASLMQHAEEIGYPAYVKGKYYEAWLVDTPAELIQKYDKIVKNWGGPVLVQEALTGDEYDVLGLADEAGEIVGHCEVRKMLRTQSGKAFAGIVVDDPQMMELAKRIIRKLKWSGPFEIEFLKVPGRPHCLFEINPRFPAWVDFPSQLGCNLPVRLVEMLLGEKLTLLKHCEAGQMFIRHSIDLVADFSKLARLTSCGEQEASKSLIAEQVHVMRPTAYEAPLISGELGRSAEAAIDRNYFSRGAFVPPLPAIDGVEVSRLVKEFGSPLFVFSEHTMRTMARRVKEAFDTNYKKYDLAWSYKTNNLNAICQIFHSEGWLAEVVSDAEYEKARKLGVAGEDIIFNGPHKCQQYLELAIKEGALVQIDNWDELERVEKIAGKEGKPVEVGIRIWLDAGVRPIWSKFGFALANGEALRAATRIITNKNLVLHTIHTHIGTYILAPNAYRASAQQIIALREHLYREEKHLVPCINLGGGFPSNSVLHGMNRSDELIRPVEEYAHAITSVLNELPDKKKPLLRMELGRHVVDDAGYLVSSVVAVKGHNRLPPVGNDLSAVAAKEWQILQVDSKRSLVLDAGINLLYTAAWFEIGASPAKRINSQIVPTRLYGDLCMAIDVIRESVDLPLLDVGDILTLHPVGAYNLAQSMQFIFYKPAAVLINENGKPQIIRRREVFDDINRLESLPSHLSGATARRAEVNQWL